MDSGNGMPFDGNWSVLMKTVGAPAAFTIAAYFAYKRFLFVPEPFAKPVFHRAHISNKGRCLLP